MFEKITNAIVALFKGSLAHRSTKAISAFSKVQNNLISLNSALIADNAKKIEAIEKAEQKIAANSEVVKSNKRVIENLNKILG